MVNPERDAWMLWEKKTKKNGQDWLRGINRGINMLDLHIQCFAATSMEMESIEVKTYSVLMCLLPNHLGEADCRITDCEYL